MKKTFATIISSLTVICFASINDTLMKFSTPGPDTYADGSTIIDGECYALVWSPSSFGGFKGNGTLIQQEDKLVLLAPLAKNGACPRTLFQIDAATAESLTGKGSYSIYLLDTRVKAEDGTVKLASIKSGRPLCINAFVQVGSDTNATITDYGIIKMANIIDGGATTTIQSLVENPIITNIKVDNWKTTIKVDNMFPNVKYHIVAGSNPDDFKTTLTAKPSGNCFEFKTPIEKFFKIVGERAF